MTTPPQGPWGPGQPGGQPGGQHGGPGGQPPQQGGWGQQPPGQGGGGWGQRPQQQQPPQQDRPGPGQTPQGQPPYDRPPQQGGWGQQPVPPQQGGWGQRSPQQQGGPYQQQSWGQRVQQPGQQQGGWHQQQGLQPGQPQWQPGPGGSKGPGGISKDKLPLIIGGGVVGIVLIGLLVFLGIHAFGGDDDPVSNPTTTQQPTGNPTNGGGEKGENGENGELGNATGQAKAATEKLQGNGFGCSDLFNTGQGAHRGCFKYDGNAHAEAVFQFQPDGTIIGVRIESQNEDNINNAAVVFDQALQAIGNDAFGGDQVKRVQDAVKTGQKSQKVGSTWGEFQLRNDGDTLELSGGKSGADSFDIPPKSFDTTKPQMITALKAKQYVCTTSCTKQIGKYGSQRLYFYASEGEGIKDLELTASGDPADVKKALPTAVNDAFGVLKGGDAAALKTYIQAHSDGKSYAAYVAGWRVEITGNNSDDYASQRIDISYESFYV
jgi:hypothetical protein